MYGDLAYLNDMVEADKKSIVIFRDGLIKNNINPSLMFDGVALELIKN